MEMQKDNLKAAIYIRVSSRDQVDGYSLDGQERLLRIFCESKKMQIYNVYADEGISAKNIKNRPSMIRLLEDAKEKKFDVILVWKLTRFSRNMTDLMTTCELLDKLGITLISYSEAFDNYTPAGRMVRSMLGAVAQFEREVISENVKMGMLERATQGKRTCSEVLGYDKYGKDSFTINVKEAEYVQYVFNNYLRLKNLSEVAKLCQQRGYVGKRGKQPTAYSISVILTRPIYCGYNTFCGSLYKGNHTPIISIEQYNRVQFLLKKQGKATGRTRLIPFTYLH